MDWDSLAELDVTALVMSLIVGVVIWSSFGFEGLGWDLMPVWTKITVLVGGVVITYFVSSAVINS